MEKAICIKCGLKKKRPFHKCRGCGYTPGDEVFRLFLPGIIFLGVLFGILVLLKLLKQGG